jgi:hypothetical protein
VLFSPAMATWCGFWCSNERMWTRGCMACRSWVPRRKCPRGIVSGLSLYSICFKYICVCNVFYVYIYIILYYIILYFLYIYICYICVYILYIYILHRERAIHMYLVELVNTGLALFNNFLCISCSIA